MEGGMNSAMEPDLNLTAYNADIDKLRGIAEAAIDSAANDLAEISQQIWMHPELYYKEYRAHKLLTDFLEHRGFCVERSYKLSTAFRATFSTRKVNGLIGAEPAVNVAVLCEYDALPDIGHACGHNLIAEVGVGAALGVKAALETAGVPVCQLTVLGTPAEEEGGGKIDLIDAGAFDNVDVALMSHPGNFSAVHTNFSALQEVTVRYYGHSSHAASDPWEGINALDAAVLAYNNVSCLRQQMRNNCRIHGIITKGGTAPNIIPSETEMFYYIRAPRKTQLFELRTKVAACFEAAAVATGCKVEFDWHPKTYLEVITNRSLGEAYERNAQNLGVEFTQDPDVLESTVGSTDMGNVSHVVPSIHPHFYIGGSDPGHSPGFTTLAGSDVAQELTLREAKVLALTAIDVIFEPGLLQRIQRDFEQDMTPQAIADSKPF